MKDGAEKQGMDWRYLNGILRRWDKEGLRTLREVQEDHKPKPAEKKDRSLEEFMNGKGAGTWHMTAR